MSKLKSYWEWSSEYLSEGCTRSIVHKGTIQHNLAHAAAAMCTARVIFIAQSGTAAGALCTGRVIHTAQAGRCSRGLMRRQAAGGTAAAGEISFQQRRNQAVVWSC